MDQDSAIEQQERRDFFVSYEENDRQWAEWIAVQLEKAGYTLFLEAWDFRPGSNRVLEMDKAAKKAERTLLVLSSSYLQKGIVQAQWANAFQDDPTGVHHRLLPVRIEPCIVDGLLRQIVGIDLVGLDEVQASAHLLAGVEPKRIKSATVTFPRKSILPANVAFPGPQTGTLALPFSQAGDPNRQRMLARVRLFWITDFLQPSLTNKAPLNPHWIDCPKAVADPWEAVVQRVHPSPQDSR